MKKLLLLAIVSALIVSGCAARRIDPKISADSPSQSSYTETNEQDGLESPDEFHYFTQDDKNIIFNGTHWIDECHIIICEEKEGHGVDVLVFDTVASTLLSEYHWETESRGFLSFGLTDAAAVVINGSDVVVVNRSDFTIQERQVNNYIDNAVVSAINWQCTLNSPAALIAPNGNETTALRSGDGFAYLVTSYENWSPNGEYLLVTEDSPDATFVGPSDIFDGVFAIVDTQGNVMCDFTLRQGEGFFPTVMWSTNNTLLVYRAIAEPEQVTVQEYNPSTKSYTEETIVPNCFNVFARHSGLNHSLLYGNEGSPVLYDRQTGELRVLDMQDGGFAKLSPDDSNILIQNGDEVIIFRLQQ